MLARTQRVWPENIWRLAIQVQVLSSSVIKRRRKGLVSALVRLSQHLETFCEVCDPRHANARETSFFSARRGTSLFPTGTNATVDHNNVLTVTTLHRGRARQQSSGYTGRIQTASYHRRFRKRGKALQGKDPRRKDVAAALLRQNTANAFVESCPQLTISSPPHPFQFQKTKALFIHQQHDQMTSTTLFSPSEKIRKRVAITVVMAALTTKRI